MIRGDEVAKVDGYTTSKWSVGPQIVMGITPRTKTGGTDRNGLLVGWAQLRKAKESPMEQSHRKTKWKYVAHVIG